MEGYKLIGTGGVERLFDSAMIPDDDRNRDWREYKVWLAAGNTPLPADESTDDALLERLPAWEKSERAAGIEHAGQRWLTADRQIVPLTFTELQSLWQAITARGDLSALAGNGAANRGHEPR
ncbi:hypothetical protein LHK_01180 [Laribacter hongkongensis HLHK9]|uniref:Uncharacterized protein n=1 Tax=Laribacter hongkongensis (strain HLHK9) TaxID=557598 RepID=C1D6R4_LARHH|nr:hypothetical protein [Laribacter hongkongensis]ACO74171.1 hypothetical protein LHK_01180 [Laribacter hongkongensis HLHK9]